MKAPETPQDWYDFAIYQLDSFEQTARAALAALDDPPTGNQAERKRELRRRARIEKLPNYLKTELDQIARCRRALVANPSAAEAVYHALMIGMLSHYPDTADVIAQRMTHREAAYETNYTLGRSTKVPGR